MSKGGGILQIVAVGPQDIATSGNPETSFYRQVFKRYTNFGIENKVLTFEGASDFGQSVTLQIPRNFGDLLGPCYLAITLPPLYLSDGSEVGYTNSIGHALIQEISVMIGEKEIDRHTGEYMQLMTKLETDESKRYGVQEMIGEIDGFPTVTKKGPFTVYVPLHFWFCKDPGLYLPLIALQHHAVRINLTIAKLQQLFYNEGLLTCSTDNTVLAVRDAHITKLELLCDIVQLDIQERRTLTSTVQQYVIPVTYTSNNFPLPAQATQVNVPLDFKNQMRELVWVVQREKMLTVNEPFNYSSRAANESGPGPYDLINSAVVLLDGEERFERRDAAYFRTLQPYRYHTAIPSGQFIYTYSFCLDPESSVPNGTLNFSRFQRVVLQIAPNNTATQMPDGGRGNAVCRVYGRAWNYLKVLNGMGGLLFPA